MLKAMLAALGIGDLGDVSWERPLSLAPRPVPNQQDSSALVRSIAALSADHNSVRGVDPAPGEGLIPSSLEFLRQVRGLVASTLRHHLRTALGPLEFLGCDNHPEMLKMISSQRIEVFAVQRAKTIAGGSPQHLVSQLRSLLCFLATRG